MAGNCFAFGKVSNEQEILADMYANPRNYVCYGGASTGFSFYINKRSIDVQQYTPPNYIIAAREITHHLLPGENIVGDRVMRFRYDYKLHKMWLETFDENNNLYWKEINPAKSKNYHDDNWVAAGEILFYLAYNISFYDEIKTQAAKDYINEGRSRFSLLNLDNGGDGTVWHVYNHKTNQIEWWKYMKNPKTNKEGFTKIR